MTGPQADAGPTADAGPKADAGSTADAGPPTDTAAHVSVLLAEHEPEVAEMAARYLRRDGLRVRLVTGPELTLAELTGGPDAAAVIDLTMPGLDPRRIRRALRTPVIFLFAGSGGLRPRGLAVHGQRRWLARPFSPRQLVTMVRDILAEAKAEVGAGAKAGVGAEAGAEAGAGAKAEAGAGAKAEVGAGAKAEAGAGAKAEAGAGAKAEAGAGAKAEVGQQAENQTAQKPGRSTAPAPPALPVPADRNAGGWRLDTLTRSAVSAGHRVPLTATEFAVLAILADHPGRVLSRRKLLAAAGRHGTADRAADVHIAQIRAKLGPTCAIRTIRGVGYALDQ